MSKNTSVYDKIVTNALEAHANGEITDAELDAAIMTFVAPRRHTPAYEVWLNSRRARNQLYWVCEAANPRNMWEHGLTENGIPYSRRKMENAIGRPTDLGLHPHGFNRPSWIKKERARNGRKEWFGYGDAWGKPWVHDKSSRVFQRTVLDWEQEAMEALESDVDEYSVINELTGCQLQDEWEEYHYFNDWHNDYAWEGVAEGDGWSLNATTPETKSVIDMEIQHQIYAKEVIADAEAESSEWDAKYEAEDTQNWFDGYNYNEWYGIED